MGDLLAGVSRVDITPPPGTPHAGWGAQKHQRDAGHDLPLEAHCLVFKDELTKVAIIDVDLINLSAEQERNIALAASTMTDIAIDNIRISATHTHSGPNINRLPIITDGLDTVQRYIDGLADRIAGGLLQATRNLRPVRVSGAEGSCNINVNRRFLGPDGQRAVGQNPTGPVDRTVRVVRVDDLDEKPFCILMHYACHPTIVAWQNDLVTPDYPGVAKRVVEQQMGCPCLFLQGATGDIGPRLGFTGDLSVYKRLGTILGLEAAKVALGIDTLERSSTFTGYQESGARIALYRDEPILRPSPNLVAIARMVKLPVRQMPPSEELEAQAVRLRQTLSSIRSTASEEEVREATAMATQAMMRADRARLVDGRSHLERKVLGISIGSIALISTQGEPFCETNERIVQASPFTHTLFSGYSHGGGGYIPSRVCYDEGGYEVETSLFSPEASDILADHVIHLLNDMAVVPSPAADSQTSGVQ